MPAVLTSMSVMGFGGPLAFVKMTMRADGAVDEHLYRLYVSLPALDRIAHHLYHTVAWHFVVDVYAFVA
jgi:hypothetical protein